MKMSDILKQKQQKQNLQKQGKGQESKMRLVQPTNKPIRKAAGRGR